MEDDEITVAFDNHDCHKSEEDGCEICEAYYTRFYPNAVDEPVYEPENEL